MRRSAGCFAGAILLSAWLPMGGPNSIDRGDPNYNYKLCQTPETEFRTPHAMDPLLGPLTGPERKEP